jgi:DNA-binding MarR family transcriptional regulator
VASAEGNVAQDLLGHEQIGPELADIVSRLRRAMRRAARAADPALGLSVAQLELLSCMAEHPGIRPSQLARMLRLAPSSVATLLGGLQSAGYVMRTPGGPGADGTADRRTVNLDLSDQGAAAVSRWHRVNEEIIQAALAALSQRDRAALRDAAPALRDLTSSIDAQADLAPGSPRRIGGQESPQPLPFLVSQVMTIQSIRHCTDLHQPGTKIHGTRPKRPARCSGRSPHPAERPARCSRRSPHPPAVWSG